MLVIPHIIDQFIWGKKVAELGIGPQPIPRNKLNAAQMAEALRQMRSPEMRTKAGAMGEKIRQEEGVELALRLIHENMAGTR